MVSEKEIQMDGMLLQKKIAIVFKTLCNRLIM